MARRGPSTSSEAAYPPVTNDDVGHSSDLGGRYRNTHHTTPSPPSLKRRRTATHSTSDEGALEDDDSNGDDEDSGDETDDLVNDDEDPEDFAPSGGAHMGAAANPIPEKRKALGPAFKDDVHRQAGPKFISTHLSVPKKRTMSEVSVRSVLSNADYEGQYPRKKIDRRLSNRHSGLMAYNHLPSNSFDNDNEQAMVSSGDEVYNNLDKADESDEDESDVEQLEEQFIIEEVQDEIARLPALAFMDDANFGLFDNDLDLFNPAPEDVFGRGDDGSESEVETTPRPKRVAVKSADVLTRRVRFFDEGPEIQWGSGSESSDTASNVFPDLCDEPGFAHHLDTDIDTDIKFLESSDGEGSYWDFGGEEDAWLRVHTESESNGSNDEAASLSGYDTDGETTDEDLPPRITVHKPETVLHRPPPSASKSTPTTPRPFPRNKGSRKGPVLGSFVVDHRKAVAFIDPMTKQLKIKRPVLPRIVPTASQRPSTADSTATNSPHILPQMPYDGDGSAFMSLKGRRYDIMMSGLLDGPLLVGPPEAFFPFTSVQPDGKIETDDDALFSSEDEMDDMDVDITHWLDCGSDEDDNEAEDTEHHHDDDDDLTSGTATDVPDSTPVRRPKSNSITNMMEHFDRGIVNSFRNNQDRYRAVSKFPHDISSVVAPVRSGKTAEELMTPPRKRKNSGAGGSTLRQGLRQRAIAGSLH
ncbi:hypothetical protein EJ06DRAFT_523189 [Trichodelitschia bisporula]|uniref:Uncharacterized protein n=1 Tax=Trichodelitschia bisporula TaxID=703511 RepID=A0A6G1HR07_9PEZI|nr:hypothetical protein EJ06DRAFT_523189 [Trichodelitschia bisporula]